MGKENEVTWEQRLAVFDFEVTAYDWLIVIKDRQTGIYHSFHNDPQGLEDFINEHDYIYIGYNNKHYDNYILRAVLHHYIPGDIKIVNDWIIIEKNNGWEYPFEDKYLPLPPTSDLMLDMPLRQSLKELEGNMCMDIQESTIDFNIDHAWNREEFNEMEFYCKHDVNATDKLVDERIDYLESKAALGEMCELTVEQALYKTNAQLSAVALGAKRIERDDYRDYVIPPEVDQSLIPESILNFIDRFKSVKKDDLNEDNAKLKWTGDIAGVPHIIGLGGIHGAIRHYIEESNEKRIILNYDVASYYPSLLIEYNYLSRNVPDPQIYIDYYHERLKAKKAGDLKKANGLKLVLNTTYGASLNKYNDLYDPLMGVSTCLTGQLLLTQLIVQLNNTIDSFRLIQSNTDGIMFSIDRADIETARKIVSDWSKHTRLGMEEDQIKKVVQKDVNGYLIELYNGKLKVKGGYVSDYKPSFKHNSLSIVATAIVDYFTKDKPVEETINECNDPFKFQLIAKTGSSYDKTVHYVNGEEIQVQKVNRLYAVDDERYGVVKKIKKQYLELDEDGERRYYINQKGNRTYKKKWETDKDGDFFIRKDTTQNCPEHALIDNSCQITIDTIDKSWYIKLAKKRINDFLGIKEKKTKGGKKKMPAAAKKTIEPKVALYKKIFDLGVWLAKQPYIADGYNDAQSYEYVGSSYYREVLGEGCREVGLLFKFNIANRLFTVLEKTKNMNLTTLLGSVTFIDPDTGEHEDYTVMGDGADMLDKGMYKAETMMIKYFVLNNFLLPKTQDDVDPESGKEDKKAEEPVEVSKSSKVPPTKEQRKEAVKEVVNNDAPTEQYVNEIIALIDAIRDSGYTPSNGKPYAEGVRNKCVNFLKGEYPLSKVEAVKLMNQIEERADKLDIGGK